MTTFKVINYFQWGNLSLEPGQILLIENQINGSSLVSVNHYPEKNQLVSTEAVESMVFLKKIKRS